MAGQPSADRLTAWRRSRKTSPSWRRRKRPIGRRRALLRGGSPSPASIPFRSAHSSRAIRSFRSSSLPAPPTRPPRSDSCGVPGSASSGALPRRTSTPRSRKPSPDTEAGDLSTALLLEGDVDAERARAALASPVRRWIVEHPGRVRLSARDLGRLRAHGVTWSALEPVRLLGLAVCARTGPSGRAPFSRVPVWRVPVTSRARARKPARK